MNDAYRSFQRDGHQIRLYWSRNTFQQCTVYYDGELLMVLLQLDIGATEEQIMRAINK